MKLSSSSASLIAALIVAGGSDGFSVLSSYSSRYHHQLSSTKEDNVGAEDNNVIIKQLPDSAVEIHIPVPGAATKAAYEKVCTELSKQVSIAGFRKGSKIPPAVLEQYMMSKGGGGRNKNAVKVQAISELMSQLVEPALKQHSLDPIGQPSLLDCDVDDLAESYQPGEPITLPVRCDVWPEIEWKASDEEKQPPYVGLTGSYTRKPFNQERLDRAVMDLRERYATLETITDDSHALTMGDACTVNMEGFLANDDDTKGEPLPSGVASGENVEVVLGPGRYMEGLVEGLIGAKVGETKTVLVSFPDALRDKTLAGKRAIFDVTVLQASARHVPEITNAFAERVRAGLTADSLMDELKKAIDQEDSNEFVPARNKALADALAQVMDVQVPDTLVTNQAKERFAMMMADMRDNGVSDDEIKRQISPENFAKYKDIVKDDIIRDFKVSMATDEIARLENIQVEEYQVQEQLEAVKKEASEQQDEIDDNMLRAKVETTLQRQAVMDWLAERAELNVKFSSETNVDEFNEELMQQLADETIEAAAAAAASAESSSSSSPSAAAAVDAEVMVVDPEEAAAAAPELEEAAAAASDDDDDESDDEKAARYAEMSLEERAFQILKDTGALDKE